MEQSLSTMSCSAAKIQQLCVSCFSPQQHCRITNVQWKLMTLSTWRILQSSQIIWWKLKTLLPKHDLHFQWQHSPCLQTKTDHLWVTLGFVCESRIFKITAMRPVRTVFLGLCLWCPDSRTDKLSSFYQKTLGKWKGRVRSIPVWESELVTGPQFIREKKCNL